MRLFAGGGLGFGKKSVCVSLETDNVSIGSMFTALVGDPNVSLK